MIRPEALEALKGLIESGKVKPVIDRTCPLENAADTLAIWNRGTCAGRSC